MTEDEFKKMVKYIAEGAEDEMDKTGLSDGIYLEFAERVIRRYSRIITDTLEQKICVNGVSINI